MGYAIHAFETDEQYFWTHPVPKQCRLGYLSLGVFQGVEPSFPVCKCYYYAIDEVISKLLLLRLPFYFPPLWG